MKRVLIILLCATFFIMCGQKKLTNEHTVEKYFKARNSADYEDICKYINDSLTVIEGDYVMPYSTESYYEVFKWDSIFQTQYEVVELKEIGEKVIVSVALTSIRNEFLQNSPMTCEFKMSFKTGKISKIESLDCKDANWEKWQKMVNTLVRWIEINHPELNGFINDMTKNGAQNYLKAIELFEASKND